MDSKAQEFFTEIYIKKYPELLRIAKRHLKDPSRAEDVTQEVFISLQLGINNVIRYKNPGGWLYRVLMNKIADELTAQTNYTKMQMSLMTLSQQPTHGSAVETRLLDSSSPSVFEMLEKSENELLTLIYGDKLKTKDAASILGISNEACRKRLYRTKLKLAKLLKENE